MKVLLCGSIEGYGNNKLPPMNLTFLAANIAEEHDVRIAESQLGETSLTSFRKYLEKFNPDVVGMTFNVENRFGAFRTAAAIKEVLPNTVLIAGGVFSTYCHREILEDVKAFDIVVRGEGDFAIKEILDHLPKGDLSNIRGITYREGEKIKVNEPRPFIKDLDELPMPAFDLLNINKYPNYFKQYSKYLYDADRIENVKHTIPMMFGRGCPFNCVFCSSKEMWHRTYRIVKPEKAVEQVKFFYDKGVRSFAFWDDHLILFKEWFYDFADLLKKEKIDIYFKCLARADAVDQKIAKRLGEMGCMMTTVGIENGSPRVLKLMNKHITPEQSEKAVKLLYENRVATIAGCIINTPGETLADITASLKFFKMLEEKYKKISDPPIPMKIYPGSDLERIATEGKRLDGFRWTSPFFEKRNLLLSSNPYVPLYENIPTEKLLRFLAKESLRLRYDSVFRKMVSNHILNPDSHQGFGDQLKERKICIKGFIDGFSESRFKEKIDALPYVTEKTFGYKIGL